MSKAKHTAPPWHCVPTEGTPGDGLTTFGLLAATDDEGTLVADGMTEVDAQFAARAVNNFDTLLMLAKATEAELTTVIPYLQGPFLESAKALRTVARAALQASAHP